jgi:hypothetical protein
MILLIFSIRFKVYKLLYTTGAILYIATGIKLLNFG